MALYAVSNDVSLVRPEDTGLTIRRVDGVVFGPDQSQDFPVTIPLANGHIVILDADTGALVFDDGVNPSDRPSAGFIMQSGIVEYTLWDGTVESDVRTFELWIRGVPEPPQIVYDAGQLVRHGAFVVDVSPSP